MQSNNLDELPVGASNKGGGNGDMDEYGGGGPTTQASDAGAPLDQRLVSKNWSVRAAAFEEIGQAFKVADTPQAEVFRDHSSLWKKYLGDANPGSLEKCLDALNVFIDRCEPKLVSSAQNDIIKALIEKCIGHTKPTIKQKSLDCFLMLFEVTEAFDDSFETMAECTMCSGLVALNAWLSNYGVKKIKVKNFLGQIEQCASSSFPAVRTEAMNFYKECYKFLGEGLKPLIANLKKQQLDDLEKDFQELKDKPKTLRLTRNEKLKQKDIELDQLIQKEKEESKDEDTALDLYESADLLTKYDGAWQDKILELKAWKEKKDLLEELYAESNVPKIKEGDFSGIAKVLKKLIGDANITVSLTAIKVCGTLAKGLRKGFEPQTRELMPALIQKFKEKKTQMIEEIQIVLETFLLCADLESLLSEVVAGLMDKAPSIKKNVCLFLEKAAQRTFIDVLQRASGELIQALIKLSDDPDGEVRNQGLSCLGILKGRIGEAAMGKYLTDMNPQKLQKVNEAAQTVKPSKYDRPEKQEPKKATGPPAKATAAKKGPPAKTAPKKQAEVIEEQEPIKNNFDEQRGGNKKPKAVDEQPLGGIKKPQTLDDQPIGGNKSNNFEDQAIGGNKNNQMTMMDEGGAADDVPIKRGAYNLDNLDDMDAFGTGGMTNTQPKRAPPARFAKKPPVEEEKKEAHADVDMADDSAPVVERKPPPRKEPPKAKPSTTTTTAKHAVAKGPTGPQIGDDEATQGGLSKEDAEAKVQETFPGDIVAKFEEAKWQDKVEGFKGLSQQLAEMQPDAVTIEAVAKFVKMKMKDWKESNINLIKETIALFTVIQQSCEKVNKRAVGCAMSFLCDKLGDVKHTAAVSDLLMGLSELVTPKFIALQVVKYATSAKAPKAHQESCNLLNRLVDDFGALNLPLKEMIDYTILAINNTNPQVRTSAMQLFAIMYRHAGETIKNFLKDIKESTMKLLEEEFAKVTPFKKGEYQKKRGFRGEAAVEDAPAAGGKKGGAGGGGGGLDDLFPRADISKQLTPKLMPMFKHQDWKVRKEAADKVEAILREASMRIQPVGLNELMDNMKQRMNDPNKAVLKAYLQLMGLVVEALGPAAKQFSKKMLPVMLQSLADKQSLVRADVIVAMDKWADQVGAEVIISIGVPLLSQENPELRTEMLKWVIKNKDSIKLSEVKELNKPLVQCLSDKTPAIRTMAEEVIGYVMPITGYTAFQSVMSDLLPAVQNAIKPILERIKVKVGATNVVADNMNSSAGPQKSQPEPKQSTQQVPSGPTLKKQVSEQIQQQQQQTLQQQQPSQSAKPQIKAKAEGLQQKQADQPKLNQSLMQTQSAPVSNLNQSLLKRKEQTQTPSANKQRSESKEVPKPKAMLSQFKTSAEEPQAEILNINFGYKERRSEFYNKNKFQLEEVKGDQLEKLKQYTTQLLGQSMTQKMFSNDFKQHIEAVELFQGLIQTNPEGLIESLDILFKWSLIRLLDSSNTKFAVAVFDFFAILLQHLAEVEYQLWDFEAVVLIPLLCDKTGLNNKILQEKVKKLVKLVYDLYDKKTCYSLIVQYGLNSKNLRAQAECLDELSEFISRFGMDFSSEKEMRLVAKMADHSDKNIRENALKFMGEAYKHLEDNIWRVIGEVTPKVQGLLEGRFKKLKGGQPGLASSNSSSNFFRGEAQLALSGGGIREASPASSKVSEGFKTQTNFGMKKPLQQSNDPQKQTTTPRSQLQFSKLQNNAAANKGQQELSKSINQFNSSNRSNEENKKATPVTKKQDMLKKVMSSDNATGIQGLQKRPIPQTTRPDLPNNESLRGSEKSTFAAKKMFYQQDDDDEDLRILINEDNFGDPELDKLQDEITKHIHQLKYADLSKRVDSLVSLNEMISALDQNRPVLVRAANELVGAFTHVLNDIFDKAVEEIPLRFAKYFITIVLKTCSCKEIMREVSEERIFDLAEQLLTRLLIDNLDKVGDNKEGELILKNLNSSMLRLLENCNHTYIFCVLFNLLRKYKDYPLMPKLPNLIIKCLLKLSKILEKLIDKLDIEKILLAIHEYLVVINHDNKTQNDEMGIRIVKTVTNELVKLKRDQIWEAYRVIQCHNQQDHHIYRWIQIILKSLQTQGSTTISTGSSSQNIEAEIKAIVEELRSPDKFEQAIPKLYRFMEMNPQIDLNDYLQECSPTFQKFIRTNLDKHRSSVKEEVKQTDGFMDSLKSTNNSDNPSLGREHSSQQPQESSSQLQSNSGQTNRISEYQSKLASIKQRNTMKSGTETVTNRENLNAVNNQHQQMNTSFSAMNSSLSQKWHEINKKSAITKREGLTPGSGMQHMSSTMTGFGTQANLASRANVQPMNQSIGAQSSGESGSGGATNQDLNKRLAEMKAKLQALKKK